MAITNCYQFTLSIKLYYRSEVKKRKKKKTKKEKPKKKNNNSIQESRKSLLSCQEGCVIASKYSCTKTPAQGGRIPIHY